MRPVIFVKHPNQNRFIGTFDMDDLQEWWLSEPLPGDVAEVVDVDWAYAQYHVCVCEMGDGTYSIIRTKDYGQSWYEVLNLGERIYSITRIDYGWLLAATESGWYESTRSGLEGTWSKVSTQAPGCKAVVNIGENILVAHDGTDVWRSIDVARNWTKTLRGRNIYYKKWHGGFTSKTYDKDIYPALAGFGEAVMAGIGPYLLISEDQAQSWTMPWGWSAGYVSSIQPYTSQRILQLLHTDRLTEAVHDGNGTWYDVWMARVYMPARGIVRHLVSYGGMFYWTAVFDTPFTGYDQGNLTAHQVLTPGSDVFDSIVFSSTSSRTTRYSINGGWDWDDLDPSGFAVYEGDPSQGKNTETNPFIEEDFSQLLWEGHPCHNEGKWIPKDGIMRRGVSYDLDWLLSVTKVATITGDVVVKKIQELGADYDALVQTEFETTWTMDDFRKKAFDRPYLGHAYVRDTFDQGADHDMVLVHRYIWPWEMDILQQKALTLGWYNDILQRKAMVDSCEMAMYLVEDLWDEIVNDIDKTMPQVWRLETPVVPKRVLDSRVEDFDDAGGA